MGAAGWGIGCDGTAVKRAPQDGQKPASGGASLPQLGQNMIFIYFALCIKDFRYQSRDCYMCVLVWVSNITVACMHRVAPNSRK